MRVSLPTIFLSLTAAFFGTSWATTAVAADPGACQVSDNCHVDDVAPQCQQSCGCQEEPGLLASAFGRFFNPTECEPRWSFSADAVALQRSSTRSQVLFRELDSTTALLNAHEWDTPAAMGFQVGAIRHGPCGWDLELGYFQIDGWNANYSIPQDSLMVTSADGSGFRVIDSEARYTSAIHLAEINLRHQCFDGFTLLAGFRAGELNEVYNATGTGALTPTAISFDTKTFNHLYGFQVGTDYEFYNMGGPLRISALCKSGIYGNSASQRSRQIETDVSDQTLEMARNQTTFMGEVGLVTSYDVTRHLTLRASCQAMWIEGIALAPEQIGANTFGQQPGVGLDTHGGVFYYGGGLGAELKF